MRDTRIASALGSSLLIAWLAVDEPRSFDVHHTVVAQLGGEHIAHAIHRRGHHGERIVAWGDRILEWPLDGSGGTHEVVTAAPGVGYSNGGCATDLDGDGVDELVLARGQGRWGHDPELVWFREMPGGGRWTEHSIGKIASRAEDSPHDIQPFALKTAADGVLRGVIVLIARRTLVWFEIPPDATARWTRHEIGTFESNAPQSGMAVGDVSGRGRPDVVCGMFWAECPENPRQSWKLHRYGSWDSGGSGGMAKLALADLDGDGAQEIVASEAEIPNARLGVFRRAAADPAMPWTAELIDQGLYCPHSLVVDDLDGDGRSDIIVGEMTAGGWDFPRNVDPKIYAYANQEGRRFRKAILVSGWGVHELALAPRRAHGDTLIIAADEIQPQKFPDMHTHVSTWRIGRAQRSK